MIIMTTMSILYHLTYSPLNNQYIIIFDHTGPDDPLFTDLSSLKVVGRLKVQHEDDTPLAPGEAVSCVNMFPESLWAQINVFVSGIPVSGV